MIQDIENYFNDENRTYEQGITLLDKYGHNPHLVRVYRCRSAAFQQHNLETDLAKLNDAPVRPPIAARKLEDPHTVSKAKGIIAELWVLLSRYHNDLLALGTENDAITMRKRKKILDAQRPLWLYYDSIYEAKEDYYRRGCKVTQELTDLVYSSPLNGEKKKEKTPKKESKKDLSSKDGMYLLRRQHALRTSITRNENYLRFQQHRKGVPNPLPACPLREKLEKEISALKAEFEMVTEEIEKRKIR
jgi:hypothetical protein